MAGVLAMVALADNGNVVLTLPVVIDPAKSYILVRIGDSSNHDKPLAVTVLETDPSEQSESTAVS